MKASLPALLWILNREMILSVCASFITVSSAVVLGGVFVGVVAGSSSVTVVSIWESRAPIILLVAVDSSGKFETRGSEGA